MNETEDGSPQAIDIFPWNENFNTGLEDVDRQHRKLVALLNRLATHVAFKADLPYLNGILDELTDYTVYHFETEESIWHQYMPDDETEIRHRATHQGFVEAIQRFRQEQATKPLKKLMEEALAFLARWLASHILETDRQMAYVVRGMQAGMALEDAKRDALQKMSGSTKVLIDIILSIYATLSTNTLNLMRELSEHQKYEIQLHASEARYRLIAENSTDVIWVLDLLTSRVTYVSPSVTKLIGYATDEIVDHPPGFGMTPESATATMARLEEVRARIETGDRTRLTRSLEVECRHRDGRLVQTEMVVTYVLDDAGKPVSLVGVVRDISLRKRAERALRESEERHRLIIESAAEGFWMIDSEQRTAYVNSALCAMLGYGEEEMIGRHPGEFADEENKAIFRQEMARIGETHHRYYEIQLRHKDGYNVPLYFQATTHFGNDGRKKLSFAFVTDLTELRQARERLARSELELQAIFDTEPECVKLLAFDGTLLRMNKAGLEMIEADTFEQVRHRKMIDLVVPRYQKAFMDLGRRVFSGGTGTLEFEIVGLKGTHRWLETHAVPLRDTQGGIVALLGVTRDISSRKAADHALRIAAIAFESQEGMIVTDAEGRILQVNQAFMALTGFSQDEVIGKKPSFLKSGRQAPEFYQAMWQSIARDGSWQGEIWNRRKDGETFPEWLVITAVRGEDGRITNYVGAFTDLTQRKAAEEQILHLGLYDALTGLPNRRLLNDRIDQARLGSQRSGNHGALIYLDLDRFKSLNDSHGHSMGDLLLVEVARRLRSHVRDGDTVARLGGDEFVVMLEDLSETPAEAASQAESVAEVIRDALNMPYQLGHIEYHSSPSIGVTLFRGKSESNDELLKRADLAMYQAKSSGRNTIRFFDPVMQEAVLLRTSMEAELRQALAHDDFVLYYQPQVGPGGEVVSVEALARWQHPERGLIPPADFIPMAEETGLIVPLGQRLMYRACMQIRDWAGAPRTAGLSVSVNVSPRQFHDPEFTQKVLATLETTGANPDRLLLEITEGVLLENTEETLAKITNLRSRGIRFSIDDFGTGYSSLAYLKRLPLDELKIDMTFVKDLGVDDNATVICATFINLAHLLGLRVVAEGVETETQRHILLDVQHCDVLQGFLIGRPMPLAELEAFLGY